MLEHTCVTTCVHVTISGGPYHVEETAYSLNKSGTHFHELDGSPRPSSPPPGAVVGQWPTTCADCWLANAVSSRQTKLQFTGLLIH